MAKPKQQIPEFLKKLLEYTQFLELPQKRAVEQAVLRDKTLYAALIEQPGITDTLFKELLTKATTPKNQEAMLEQLAQIAVTPARRALLWNIAGVTALTTLVKTFKLTDQEAQNLLVNPKVTTNLLSTALSRNQFPDYLLNQVTEQIGGLPKLNRLLENQQNLDDAELIKQVEQSKYWIGDRLKAKTEVLTSLLWLRPVLAQTYAYQEQDMFTSALATSPFLAGRDDLARILAQLQDAQGNKKPLTATMIENSKYTLIGLINNPAVSDDTVEELELQIDAAITGATRTPISREVSFTLRELQGYLQKRAERARPAFTTSLQEVDNLDLYKALLQRSLPNTYGLGRPFDTYYLATNPLLEKAPKRLIKDVLQALTNEAVINQLKPAAFYDLSGALNTSLQLAVKAKAIVDIEVDYYKKLLETSILPPSPSPEIEEFEDLETKTEEDLKALALYHQRNYDKWVSYQLADDIIELMRTNHPELPCDYPSYIATQRVLDKFINYQEAAAVICYISKNLPASQPAWSMLLSLAPSWTGTAQELVDTTISLI